VFAGELRNFTILIKILKFTFWQTKQAEKLKCSYIIQSQLRCFTIRKKYYSDIAPSFPENLGGEIQDQANLGGKRPLWIGD
jgi:hypothetical protein